MSKKDILKQILSHNESMETLLNRLVDQNNRLIGLVESISKNINVEYAAYEIRKQDIELIKDGKHFRKIKRIINGE